MSVKLLLLKSGENVISDVKELISDEKLCGYLLKFPQKLIVNQPFLLPDTAEDKRNGVQVSMAPFIYLSKDNEVILKTDWIVTIVEPIDDIKSMYEEKINGKQNDEIATVDEQSDSSDSD